MRLCRTLAGPLVLLHLCLHSALANEEDLLSDYFNIPLEAPIDDVQRQRAALSEPADLLSEHDLGYISPLQRRTTYLEFVHRAFHIASVHHAVHRFSDRGLIDFGQYGNEQLAAEGPISLPVIPKSPPVCSQPPAMRFCKNVAYPVYRPSADHTFAQLDFDSHAVFKKIAPHMRISEKHFDISEISECRANFRQFLCLRNFPRCCHVGLCNEYGAPEPPLTTGTLADNSESVAREKATKVTFINGSKDTMQVQLGRNDTVKVKIADAVCLQYVKTYTPLFDCRAQCLQLLNADCLFMLDEECESLCYGVHSEVCASKELFQIATARPAASPAPASALPTSPVGIALLALAPAAARALGWAGDW